MSENVPTTRGSLAAMPVGHLLVLGLDRCWTGTLVLEQLGGARHAIYFEGGGPSKAKTHVPVVHLGEILVEQKLISEELYRRTLAGALSERRLHGQVLLAEQAITEQKLREALREQLSRQVKWMLALPGSTLYGYYDNINFLERWGGQGVRVHPLSLIWLALRDHAEPAHVADVLARLGGQAIRLHSDAPIRRFRFDPREQSVIDVLRARPQPLAELLGRGLDDDERIRKFVYALVVLRQLETGIPGVTPIGVDEPPSSSRIAVASTRPSATSGVHSQRTPRRVSSANALKAVVAPRSTSPTPSHAPSATRGVSPSRGMSPSRGLTPSRAPTPSPAPGGVEEDPEVAALRAEIRDRAERTGDTYYGVLGVPTDAPPQVIQAAFFQLAKKWHPDRLGPEFADVKDLATRVFSRMSEAHQVLSDPLRRESYDEILSKGGGSVDEQEKVQRVLRAASAFQKAEVLMKRNKLVEAEDELVRALEDDPTQADYAALYAWLQAGKPGADLEEILTRLNRALRLHDDNLRVRWYRGQILKRLGRENRAISDFRFIVEQDPNHVDAAREVRLWEMRRSDPRRSQRNSLSPRSSGPSPAPSEKPKSGDGGLFGKWFKR